MPGHHDKEKKPKTKDLTGMASYLAAHAMGSKMWEGHDAEEVAEYCIDISRHILNASIDDD